MFTRIAMSFAFSAAAAFAADWDPAAAAKYLDSRQEKWFAWPNAASKGGPCMSCHTGMTYMLARPVLRRALGETAPARWETGMLEGVKARVEDNPAAGRRRTLNQYWRGWPWPSRTSVAGFAVLALLGGTGLH